MILNNFSGKSLPVLKLNECNATRSILVLHAHHQRHHQQRRAQRRKILPKKKITSSDLLDKKLQKDIAMDICTRYCMWFSRECISGWMEVAQSADTEIFGPTNVNRECKIRIVTSWQNLWQNCQAAYKQTNKQTKRIGLICQLIDFWVQPTWIVCYNRTNQKLAKCSPRFGQQWTSNFAQMMPLKSILLASFLLSGHSGRIWVWMFSRWTSKTCPLFTGIWATWTSKPCRNPATKVHTPGTMPSLWT